MRSRSIGARRKAEAKPEDFATGLDAIGGDDSPGVEDDEYDSIAGMRAGLIEAKWRRSSWARSAAASDAVRRRDRYETQFEPFPCFFVLYVLTYFVHKLLFNRKVAAAVGLLVPMLMLTLTLMT